MGTTQEEKTFSLGDRYQPFPLVSRNVSDGYDVNATATIFSVVFFQAARKGQSLLRLLSTFPKIYCGEECLSTSVVILEQKKWA